MRKLCFVVVLCILFMSIEVVGGIKANSLAILTNATHLLTDVAAFSISMLSLWASSWEANPRQSYGFFRIEILGALVSIQLIWLLTGILVYEAITRLIQQTNDDVDGFFMVLVAAFGLVVNIIMIVVLGHDHGNGHCHSHSHNHEHGHGIEEVVSVHELHIWAITVGKVLFSCHVKIKQEANDAMFLDRKADARSLEVQGFKEAQSFAFKEEEEESMQDTVPFLQMLQSENRPWEVESFLSQEGHPHFYQNQVSALYIEGAKQALSSQEADMILLHSSSPQHKRKNNDLLAPDMTREKRKRRKTKPSKNIEEIENQRINHIVVERNRRRRMNEHINSLRSLLPPSYIQRTKHPFVGGAIHYAKVLEQIIQSLESQKRTQQSSGVENRVREDETRVPSIETTVVQNHVNLKVVCRKRQGELIRGIISLEKLRLTVLHLNISTLSRFYVSCCFNLKMEDGCELDSADEIKKVAHQIFDMPMNLNN
ncbi:hypothetical protein Bca52824_047734 [Brassica carinata]|uniref:BHLH domain-containing protein n=1 Tax=Brassica carinata TaxID=52824 RepID=A0A8X7RJV6_BRACI|nr:hypothetical protein Bca52824_047734 [Brassica carinata]